LPARQSLIPAAIVFLLSAISGSGDAPAISVGFTGSFLDLVDSSRTSTFALVGGTILDGGYGYVPGDLIGLNWGFYTTQAVLAVDAVNSIGAVTAYHVEIAGSYSAVPANPITTTSSRAILFGRSLFGTGPYGGGHGSGFTLEGEWEEATGPFAGVDAVGQIVSFSDFAATGAGLKYLPAGQTLMVAIDAPATYATYKLECLVFGALVGSMPALGISTNLFGKQAYGLGIYG